MKPVLHIMGRSCLGTCSGDSLTRKHCSVEQIFANRVQFLLVYVFFEYRRVFHNIHNVFHNRIFSIFTEQIFANKVVNCKNFIRKCFFSCIKYSTKESSQAAVKCYSIYFNFTVTSTDVSIFSGGKYEGKGLLLTT